MDDTAEINLLQIANYTSKKVSLKGWIQQKRGSNHVQFLMVRNSGKIIQAVAEKKVLGEELFLNISTLQQETAVFITGTISVSEKTELGYEILLESIEVISQSMDFPITPKEHGPDFLHNNRHLWIRSRKQLPVLRIRDSVIWYIRKFFRDKGYLCFDSPILTGSVGESAGTLFQTDYFDLGKAYLAQTGQLYLESAIFAFNKVYCFGPTFRAEKSKTRRHLTEFWMFEAETAFYSNQNNIELQQEFIQNILSEILHNNMDDLKILGRDPKTIQKFTEAPFQKLEYSEAVKILQEDGESIQWGDDINAEGENKLTSKFNNFVFVMNYPKAIKAFYMKENPADPRTVLCADLLAPDGTGEIIGGSEREEDSIKIQSRMREEGLDPAKYSFYLDLRKYGSVQHSGFGLGLERLIAWVCGIPHVRECIPFPRMMGRLDP